MVNSSTMTTTTTNEMAASGGGSKKQRESRGAESSPESKQDCHNVVKSSGLGPKRGRFCCEHSHRKFKVSVACQTDDGGNNGLADSKLSSTTTALDSAVFCNPTEPALSATTALRISAPQSSPKQDGKSKGVRKKQEADDCSKSEGTLRLMIHNFRNMNDTVRGPAKIVNNVPWKIMVMPRQHVVAKKGTQKCLGFFLQCFPESYSDSWSCQAAAELRLISQKQGVPNFVRKTNHVYTAKENDWGYSCFMTWADILDESQGYLKDENVILEVYVKAEPPKGILTHDQFCKKIQDYMRLSDMQCGRDLIDKALEVNQTALKFCKDKDENMKDELEKQRARLIEQKLKQSIERIEKGFSDVKSVENGETGTNLNTLRQALAGNLAAMKGSSGNSGATAGSTAKNTNSSSKSTTNAKQHSQQQQKETTKEIIVTTKTTPPDESTKVQSQQQPKDTIVADADSKTDSIATMISQNLSNAKKEKEQAAKMKKEQQVVDIDDPDPGTSDESDDDDSYYEDMEEVCDSCLVEKLENMSCGQGIGVGTDPYGAAVETQENGCQTEPPIAKPRLPPIGASLDENKSRQSAIVNNNKTTSVQQQADNQTARHPGAPVINPVIKVLNQGKAPPPPSSPTVNNVPPSVQTTTPPNSNKTTTTASVTSPLTNTTALSKDGEQKLLKFVAEESKASMDTIKDTLERLVMLAHGGEREQQEQAQIELGLKQDLEWGLKLMGNNDNIKTDVVEIAASGGVDGQKQTTRTTTTTTPMDENAKLVDMHNDFLSSDKLPISDDFADEMDDEDDVEKMIDNANQRQHQQFVQTDLSFTPRAGSPTTEDRNLLARAQAIVENKAEELVTKYSQLIEQSEANRLAETVKKVEKRMKDIEKQTITCRKELSDECERHFREEQKLVKANKQLKQQLDQANDRLEKSNNQLKDKRLEVKKLEKRLKVESQSSAENAELNSKIEQLERDLTAVRQKHGEEKQRWNEETQKFNETKRGLQQELTFSTGEVERLHTQLEEKNGAIRKLETNLKQERQQAQSSLKESGERAKKAEVGLLELRLENGLRGLQRAVDECQSHVAQLEDSAKRFTRMQMHEEAKTSNNCLQEWRKTKDKIQELIQKSKNEFGQQIDAVKSGKSLTSLPTIEVPRPPPPPATPKLLLSVQTPPEQRQQHIAPIGTAKGPGGQAQQQPSSQQQQQSLSSSSSTAAGQQQHQQQQHGSNVIMPNGGTHASPPNPAGQQQQQRAPSVPPNAAMCNGPTNQQSQSTTSVNSAMQNNASSTISAGYHSSSMTAPQTPNSAGSNSMATPSSGLNNTSTESIGVPSASTASSGGGGANGGGSGGPFDHLVFGSGGGSSSQSGLNGPSMVNNSNMPTSSSSISGSSRELQNQSAAAASSSSLGGLDFTPWATDPLNIMHTLIGAKGGFNISGFDSGFGSSSNSAGSSGANGGGGQGGASGAHELMNGSGFGGILGTSGQGTPSGRHSQDGGGQQHWSSGGGGTGSGHLHQQQQHHHWTQQSSQVRPSGSGRSQGNGSPPQMFDNRSDSPIEKRTETLIDQLRNVFQNLSPDFIRECVYEYRQNFGKNFKSMQLDQLLNGAVQFIWSRQQQGPKMSNWNSSSILGGGYDGTHGGGGTSESASGGGTVGSGGHSNEETCGMCGYALRQQAMCSLPPCGHVFHSSCTTQWILNHRSCPTCGVYSLPPEEYPDLAS